MKTYKTASAFGDSKPHYELLDGLRGVAALMVIWYHVFEGFATSPLTQTFNHGYLAVDFFFILSGFVVGYAYDDRWGKAMCITDFIKRRLIRLHPMLLLGAVLGVSSYLIQGSVKWDGSSVATSWVMIATLMTLFLIPAFPSTGPEVRGFGEMFPLNGPTWSLFFEYIGNLLYALFVRRLSTPFLTLLVVLLGGGLSYFAIGNYSGFGNLGVGWTLADYNFIGGMLRMSFSFSLGLLMTRVFKPCRIKGAFWICSLGVIICLSIPYVGSETCMWTNGLYDTVCVLVVFPVLVWLGASGRTTAPLEICICKFLGDISYPIYIIHYPFMYLFFAWLWSHEEGVPFAEAWPFAVLIFVGSIMGAYLCLKYYDMPVRRWLSNCFLQKKS